MTEKNKQDTEAPEKAGPTPDELKELGNECVKNEKFIEAVLHYSHAIKLNPNDPILYSNRSYAFLKQKQYYYANEDADKTIALSPLWAKGYFRKAEVQLNVGQYDTALLSYGKALQLQPHDMGIIHAAKRAAAFSNSDTVHEASVPWVGAGIGIILGVMLVIADQIVTVEPTLFHPALMILVVFVIACIGFGIAKLMRYYAKLQRKGLLEPPIDLREDFQKSNGDEEVIDSKQEKNRNRYTKAQARQRFKKGKT